MGNGDGDKKHQTRNKALGIWEVGARDPKHRHADSPSKTSGGSNLSGLRVFVIGISGLTWRNVEREVR